MFWTAYLVVAVLVIVEGIGSLWGGARFRRYVRRRMAVDPLPYAPRAVVLLPCKGIDRNLADTLRALDRQDYPDYRVICAFESADDPALALARQVADERTGSRISTAVAQPATCRSQKIENLVAAIRQAGDWPEVYAFVDSDAVPHRLWLRFLVSALPEERVGAATGYRWYVPGHTLSGIVRCLWNAVAMTFLGDHDRNFCWGGSMAVRREFFERAGVLRRWDSALSEDFQVARATYDAGMRVRFVPQCLIPCHGDPTWREFWTFARRQLIITRVCEPRLWWAAALVTASFSVGFWGPLLLLLHGAAKGQAMEIFAGGVVLLTIYGLGMAKAALRKSAVSAALRGRPGGAAAGLGLFWDVFASPLVATFNAPLMVASGVSSRFGWRGIRYQMKSPLLTTVLSRDDRAAFDRTAVEQASPLPELDPNGARHGV